MTSVLTEIRERQESAVFQMQAQATVSYRKVAGAVDISGGVSGTIPSAAQFAQPHARTEEFYNFFRNWVFTATTAIAKRIAGQEWMAGEITGATENPERRAIYRTKTSMQLRQPWLKGRVPPNIAKRAAFNQELNVFESHPILDWLLRPNPVQDAWSFLYLSVVNLLITGQAYWVGGITKDSEGEDKIELWALPTHWVTPLHERSLFDKYKITLGSNVEPIIVDAENVARVYLPDPTDLKGVWSPLMANSIAARTDEYIQKSQRESFEKGIHPNVVIGIGKEWDPVAGRERRPRLHGPQRRQLIDSIRDSWNQSINYGFPAITDGFIDSITKLQMTPQEMDWQTSGGITKARIMQGFHANPIAVGEIVGANRAQAVVADQQICEMAANPLIQAFSCAATDFIGPMVEEPKRLVLWLEKCEPQDREMDHREWDTGLKHNAVSKNEYRTEVLGRPPLEGEEDRAPLLDTPAALNTTVQLLTQTGLGTIPQEWASAWYQLHFQVDASIADQIVGLGGGGRLLPSLPSPPSSNGDDEEVVDDETEESPDVDTTRRKLPPLLRQVVNSTRREQLLTRKQTQLMFEQFIHDDLGRKIQGVVDEAAVSLEKHVNTLMNAQQKNAELMAQIVRHATIAASCAADAKAAAAFDIAKTAMDVQLRNEDINEKISGYRGERTSLRIQAVEQSLSEVLVRHGCLSGETNALRESLAEISKQIDGIPINVNVTNEVAPTPINVMNQVNPTPVNVDVKNEVIPADVSVVNEVHPAPVNAPPVNVQVEPASVTVESPSVTVEAPQVNLSPEINLEVPPIQVPAAEVEVDISRDSPKVATIRHADGTISTVRLDGGT